MLKERLRAARKEFSELEISEVDAELLAAFVLSVGRMDLHAKEFEFSRSKKLNFPI